MPEDTTLEIADLLDVPFYNADLTEIPAAVQRIARQAQQADGFVFACTEYNYSVAPALKNILDWLSRLPDSQPLSGKPVALMGAGGGMGTSRAQYHLRQSAVFLNLQPLIANRLKNDYSRCPDIWQRSIAGCYQNNVA